MFAVSKDEFFTEFLKKTTEMDLQKAEIRMNKILKLLETASTEQAVSLEHEYSQLLTHVQARRARAKASTSETNQMAMKYHPCN